MISLGVSHRPYDPIGTARGGPVPRYERRATLPREGSAGALPEDGIVDRLFALPLAAVFAAVGAGTLVVLANLAALVFDALMLLVRSPLTLFPTIWSSSLDLFVAIWLAATVGAVSLQSRGPADR